MIAEFVNSLSLSYCCVIYFTFEPDSSWVTVARSLLLQIVSASQAIAEDCRMQQYDIDGTVLARIAAGGPRRELKKSCVIWRALCAQDRQSRRMHCAVFDQERKERGAIPRCIRLRRATSGTLA